MIKKIMARVLNPITRVMLYLKTKSRDRGDLHFVLWRRAVESSADYAERNLTKAVLFEMRQKLWTHSLRNISIDGLWLEFGVFSGESINFFAEHPKIKGGTIYGFDSFEGLKEDWFGTGLSRGAFDRGGRMPSVRGNVELVKGWFDQTVPGFLKSKPGVIAFLHLDADTYESTKLVLELVADRIVPGTVIVFDEYLGFPNWENGEFKAWAECVKTRGFKYEYLAFSPQQAAVKII